ncbi:PKD domain-containing protein [Lewinella cohaerens]|uniref:PKD domain-containing protein n=1 Tax=Lewinella cohaerens TaxID=70995 RepID=UPI0003754E6C|nr:PKD domain-containing protein [Lewinella cohaerens]
MQLSIRLSLLALIGSLNFTLNAQCITDECGDIFADWALLSEEITVCEGATFEVINQTIMPDIDFYVWDWGNGDRDTVYEVSNYFYTYLFDEGTACSSGNDFVVYNISLEIYRFCEEGQSCHTQIAPVAIRFKPRANFSAPPIVCAGDSIALTNSSCHGDEFLWLFGDGTTSTDPNPDHVFDTAGVYDVTLVVTNQCGTDSLTLPVEVLDKPVAGSTANGSDAAIGCVPLTVTFGNNSDFADDYLWTFPDSAGVVFLDTFNAQSPTPTVEFTVPGTYTVSLQANNLCGSSEWTTTVTVLAPPLIELEEIPTFCDSASVQLGDYLLTEGDISTYNWSVSGPSMPNIPNGANPLVNFNQVGDYAIDLVVSNGYCPDASDNTVLSIQGSEVVLLELSPLGPICDASDPVSLTASPAGGFWSGLGIDSSGIFDPSITGLGSFNVQYQILDGACVYGDSMSIDILLGESVTIAENLDLCENEALVQLDFSPTGGSWSGPGIVDDQQGVFDPGLSGTGSFDLVYSLLDSSNCLLRKETIVNVQELPTLTSPDTSAFCIDAGTLILQQELNPTAMPEGGLLSWSGDFITDSANGTFTSPGEGIYSVQLSYALEACTAATEVIITIIDPEEAVVGPDQSVCISEGLITLMGTPAGGQWTGPGIMDAFSGEVDLAAAGSGSFDYTYTIAEGSSCEVSDALMLDIQGPGNLDAGTNLAFCVGSGMQNLPAPTPAGGTWSGPALADPDQGVINTSQLLLDTVYWYQYSIINANTGCSFADSVGVEIQAIPEAVFSLPDYVCAAADIRLGASPQDGVSYTWLIDGTQMLNGDSVSFSMANTGTFPVALTATNTAGCSRSADGELVVTSLPDPAFALDTPTGCGPLSVNFADVSTGVDLQYDWTLGNGESSALPNPQGVVYAPGLFDTTYQVMVAVSNACGVSMAIDTVTVLSRPVAGFGIPVDDGCGPLEISFANTSLGNAESYFWNFGNGFTSQDSLPGMQVFTTPDTAATTYIIQLIASNSCGSDSSFQELLVNPSNVTPFFGVDTTQGCVPLSVDFTNYSSFGSAVSWNFGDGTTSDQANPVHTFVNPGYYTVYQYAITACSEDSTSINIEVLPSPEALFSHPPVICPDQEIAFTNESSDFQTVFWDFGDGRNSTATDPVHQYEQPGTYQVTMIISNTAYSCQSSFASTVTVRERPEGTVLMEGASGCPPLDVCFNATATNADFYEWDFGDENSSTTLNPCHTFTASGLYTVSLRTADLQGCFSSYDTVSVVVFEEPQAGFSLPEEVYCGEQQVIDFANTSTGATSYDWTFSNGINSSLTSPSITFSGQGEYSVQLLANNTFGCQDVLQRNFQIVPQPLADFAPILIDDCAPQTVVFDNATLNSTDYYWDFGNGETSTEPNPVIEYSEAGSYDVSLVATYDGLCFDSLQLSGSVNLLPRPVANFTWELPTDMYRGIVLFNNESTGADNYLWNFGNGASSTEIDPVHDYEQNGSWQAALIASSLNGCTDTAYVDVNPDFMYDIFFPNALSPESGSGDVRVFKPAGIGLASWTLEIFSPWGQRVFVSEELSEDQPAAAWDGRYKEEILPQGAYAYKAKVEYLNGVQRIYTGSVTLLR